MQDLTCYISFSDAQKRYDIKHPALSYRIKALGLQTKRKGRNTYLTLKQIALLDNLNNFLVDNPNKTIDGFLSLQKEDEQLKNYDLTISNAFKSDELLTSISDTDMSLTSHCVSDESLTSQTIPQIKSQITHILKAISRIEACEDFVSQSLTTFTAQEQIKAKDKEIDELKAEINKLTKEREEANHSIKQWQENTVAAMNRINQLTQQLDIKNQECGEWKRLWIELIPFDLFQYPFCQVGGRVYLKTKFFNYEYAESILRRVFSLFHR
ncbi:MAG TPA: hypothetical protein VIQ31_06500 [Phormidium sp.]